MRIEQFPRHLNAHKATLGASMISLEEEKNAPNWVTANKIRLSLY
jgi:DNA-binding XRE family transcriptional regulator